MTPWTPWDPSTVPLEQRRRGALLLGAVLAVYVVGYFLFPQRVLGVSDEASYVRQAASFALGHLRVAAIDPGTLEVHGVLPSTYPVGTSLVQMPFVYAFGWRRASLASLFSLLGAAFLLGHNLWRRGRDPAWALLLVGYVPTLVLGRIAMGDLPSGLLVTLVVVLLFGPEPPGRRTLFAVGLLSGLSVLFRETNVVLLGPLCLGVVLRRERGWPALVAGGVLGLLARLATAQIIYGSAVFARPNPYGFSLSGIGSATPLYLLALLVLVPGGLAWPLGWRGPRRAEVLVTTALTFAFFCAYEYSGVESGPLRRLVLGPRYFIPLLPLLVLSAAEAAPRFASWLRGRAAGSRLARGAAEALGPLRRLGVVAVFLGAALVHPVLGAWGKLQQQMSEAIFAHTSEGAALVSNTVATGKLVNELYGLRVLLPRDLVAASRYAAVEQRFGELYLVFIDRSVSVFFEWERQLNEEAIAAATARCTLEVVHDELHGPEDRLRVIRATHCR